MEWIRNLSTAEALVISAGVGGVTSYKSKQPYLGLLVGVSLVGGFYLIQSSSNVIGSGIPTVTASGGEDVHQETLSERINRIGLEQRGESLAERINRIGKTETLSERITRIGLAQRGETLAERINRIGRGG